MIITCGQCQAKFKVAPEQIKETGSKVRCSNCRYVFTVYRPKRAVKVAVSPENLAADSEFSEYDDGFAEDATDDLYAGQPGDSGSHYEDDYDDSSSMKERRDRRRELYSDLEEEGEDADLADDPLNDLYDHDDYTGLPSLRRNRSRVSSMGKESEETDYDTDYDDDDDYEAAHDEFDPEEIRDDSPLDDEDLGLEDDPRRKEADEAANKDEAFARLAAGYADNKTASKSNHKLKLVIILAVVAAVLGAVIYFLASRPKAASLVTGDTQIESGRQNEVPDDDTVTQLTDGDPNGAVHITFTDGEHAYFYRKNNHAGDILVITGMVRNNYKTPRSFIKLRGHLLTFDDKVLADRFVYAGNILSDDELKELPTAEITTRLNIKGGRDNKNINIPPEGEVPFMVVFDNAPEGTDQYRIDPVGSDPAE